MHVKTLYRNFVKGDIKYIWKKRGAVDIRNFMFTSILSTTCPVAYSEGGGGTVIPP